MDSSSGGSRAADVSAALDARMAGRSGRRREARRSRRTNHAVSLAWQAILALQVAGEWKNTHGIHWARRPCAD